MVKVLLAIYSCKKYSFMQEYYFEKYRNIGYDDIIFVVGSGQECNIESPEWFHDDTSGVVVLNCPDTFEKLPFKTYCLLSMFLQDSKYSDFDYIIKLDDDTEFNMTFQRFCGLDFIADDKYDYMGSKKIISGNTEHNYHFGKCSDNSQLNYTTYRIKDTETWLMGCCYVLSKYACEIISTCISNNNLILKNNLYEDMMVGNILTTNEIEPFECFMSNIITDQKRPRVNSLVLLPSKSGGGQVASGANRRFGGIKKVSLSTMKNLEEKIRNGEIPSKNDIDPNYVRDAARSRNSTNNKNSQSKNNQSNRNNPNQNNRTNSNQNRTNNGTNSNQNRTNNGTNSNQNRTNNGTNSNQNRTNNGNTQQTSARKPMRSASGMVRIKSR